MVKNITIDAEKIIEKYKKEIQEFIISRHHDYMITLTFKEDVNEITASMILSRFIKRMNDCYFGRRSRKSIVVTPILERNAFYGVHYHILIQDPRPLSNKNGNKDIKDIIRDNWNNSSPITGDVYQASGGSEVWYEEIYDSKGLSEYLTKQFQLWTTDYIDFNNYTTEYRKN